MFPAVLSSPDSRWRMEFDCHLTEGETDARTPRLPFHPSPAWSNLHGIVLPRSQTQLLVPFPSGAPDPPDQASALGLGTCPFHVCGKN